MRFFIPHAAEEAQAESAYESIRQFAAETTRWPIGDRRVFSITYTHDGRRHHAEVGEIHAPTGEEVIAILDSQTYLVCTLTRGVHKGMPVLVGKNEVESCADFD